MTAERQDAWSPDDDLILAEVTLRHIREGGTQLRAFEEVGERIGRTAAACGFRWNSCVRKKYEAAIQIAKGQRQKRNQLKKKVTVPAGMHQGSLIMEDSVEEDSKELQGRSSHQQEWDYEDVLSIDSVIRYLRKWKGSLQEAQRQVKQLDRELKDKTEYLQQLEKENKHLNKAVNEVQTDYRTVNDDYKALIQIMDRARKMAFLVDEDEENKPRFKMDANGNLERVE